jgi:myosin heavy subunit
MLRSKQPGLRAVTNILEGLGKESIACGSGTVNSILETLQTTLQNKTPKLTEKMKAQLVIKHSDVSWAIEGWLEEYE